MSIWLAKRMALLLLLLVVMTSAAAMAEVKTGTIIGKVVDDSTGLGIPGATVVIVGTKLGAVVNTNGEFVIQGVPPGVYDLRFSSLDYTTTNLTGVVVVADSTINHNCRLQLEHRTVGHELSTQEAKIDRGLLERVASSPAPPATKASEKASPGVESIMKFEAGVGSSRAGEVFIRGGRKDEVAYIPDGKIVADPSSSPAHGGSAIINGQPFDATFFKNYGTNPFIDTDDDRFSTFAIDVDDASWSLSRSYLTSGYLPAIEAVRAEEFVNHFKYQPASSENEDPISIDLEGSIAPFGSPNSYLLAIHLAAPEIDDRDRKPANLTFVIDISGSMAREDRLDLVKQTLEMLVDKLRPSDQIALVVYGSTAAVLLSPTTGENRETIQRAIAQLSPQGATNAEAGLVLGYDIAARMHRTGMINRVILCSDGVANVGATGPDAILERIEQDARRGIYLTTLGFGMANYNDILMEQLANKGNGQYAYVDNIEESFRLMNENLTGMLQTVARDVKVQVEFDSSVVRSYRLIGFENRDVADSNFRNDTIDGGEMGAGQQVMGLYELKLHSRSRSWYDKPNALGQVTIRYQHPDNQSAGREIRATIKRNLLDQSFAMASADFAIAAGSAELAEIMRDSYWARGATYDQLRATLTSNRSARGDNRLSELMGMIDAAAGCHSARAER